MQIVCIEHLACAECLALRRCLAQAHKAAAASGSPPATFASWLLHSGAQHVPSSHVPLIVTFCRLMRWYHQTLIALHARSGVSCTRVNLGILRCQHTGELLHIAAVAQGVGQDGCLVFASLGHALRGKAAAAPLALRVSERFGRLVLLARDMSYLCAQQVRRKLSRAAWLCCMASQRKSGVCEQSALQSLAACPNGITAKSCDDYKVAPRMQGWGRCEPAQWQDEGLTDRLVPHGPLHIAECAQFDLAQRYHFSHDRGCCWAADAPRAVAALQRSKLPPSGTLVRRSLAAARCSSSSSDAALHLTGPPRRHSCESTSLHRAAAAGCAHQQHAGVAVSSSMASETLPGSALPELASCADAASLPRWQLKRRRTDWVPRYPENPSCNEQSMQNGLVTPAATTAIGRCVAVPTGARFIAPNGSDDAEAEHAALTAFYGTDWNALVALTEGD